MVWTLNYFCILWKKLATCAKDARIGLDTVYIYDSETWNKFPLKFVRLVSKTMSHFSFRKVGKTVNLQCTFGASNLTFRLTTVVGKIVNSQCSTRATRTQRHRFHATNLYLLKFVRWSDEGSLTSDRYWKPNWNFNQLDFVIFQHTNNASTADSRMNWRRIWSVRDVTWWHQHRVVSYEPRTFRSSYTSSFDDNEKTLHF